jgi:hypothetical protein
MSTPEKTDLFAIPLPGNRVAHVPLSVLEQYVVQGATPGHGAETSNDVTAHNMVVDATTGTSVWHTEWELGPCDYADDNGFPQHAFVYHRHPLGTEYTEIFEK